MTDQGNTDMEVDKLRNKLSVYKDKPLTDNVNQRIDDDSGVRERKDVPVGRETAEYCEKLQAWMWQYYTGYVHWQSWLTASAMTCPHYLQTSSGTTAAFDFNSHNWFNGLQLSPYTPEAPSFSPGSRGGEAGGGAAVAAQRHQLQQNGNAPRPGREYNIPSPLQRLMAEMVDFFILFVIKASIIISIMHLSGIKDVSKFALHFIVEEIDEDTSMEELQKMMLVALVYRVLVCFYEIICIWGAGGATPGKFLIGLRVVTCDSSVLVQPDRVLVVPATNVSLSADSETFLSASFDERLKSWCFHQMI
ncbi:protein FAM8A1-like isoform X2 [Gouania willdenowi]|uniref:protein FAM8A1-like isoform X2 n=1 Tax=Gouania willdenowi TaxID=441366 RepID=UPI001055A34E|nr:protein FAM8A1-like isoform X2 [Gouania willdenowi]